MTQDQIATAPVLSALGFESKPVTSGGQAQMGAESGAFGTHGGETCDAVLREG